MTLIWERRRLVCEPCGSRFSEGHQGFEGRVTARLARRLVKDARAMTVNAAAKRHQVSWKLVNSLVVAWAGLVASTAAGKDAGCCWWTRPRSANGTAT